MIIKLENNNRWLLYSGGRPRAVPSEVSVISVVGVLVLEV